MQFNDYVSIILVMYQKNVKTVIFSELPKNEKMKYFNFLLENDINFTRDENGFYIALVKVLNPAFYAEQGKQSPKHVAFSKIDSVEDSGNKPRSASLTVNTKQIDKSTKKSKKFEQPSTNNNIILKVYLIIKLNQKPSGPTTADILSESFPKIYKLINPIVGVRGKKLNFYQLKYLIEEIYSIRFIKDTSNLKSQINKTNELDIKDPFPEFIVEFLSNKFIKKPLIDQHALDLLISVNHYKSKFKLINIFAKFLNEEYDSDDLIFFLFVRSCIEKEMKMMLIERARDELKLQYQEEIDSEIYLNIKICLKSNNLY